VSSLHDNRRRRSGAAVLAVAAVLGSPEIASAQASTNDPRVEYEAPADCPPAIDFDRRLAGRTSSFEPHRGADAKPTLLVRITRSGHGSQTHGDLSVRYADGAEARRVVNGDTCDSVVDALALMSAMALERAALDATKAAVPPAPAAPPAEPEHTAMVPLDRQPGAHVALGAGGGAAFGTAPVTSPDASAFLEIFGGRGSAWSPTVRAAFDYANSGSASVTGGGVKLVRSLGSLDGCPLVWSSGAFRLLPCAHLEGGMLSASGLGVQPGRNALRPWVGAVGRVRYVTAARLFLELSGGLLAPLVRDRFFFEPNSSTTVFRAAPVSGFAGGALGFTIR
jgi:hypothetical protein